MNNGLLLKNNLITKYKPKSLNIENELKFIREILDTLKSIKRMQKKLRNEKKSEDAKEAKLIEWKEAARRLDNVFFVFSFFAVTLTPIYLFHQYLIEESPESFNKLTRCLNT
jgi:vacuolar-type H+-ATPase subunit I/STV1